MSRRDPTVIVATTIEAADDPIALLCARLGVACYRGSRDDVAARLNGALLTYATEAKWVARGMSDSPLVDVGLADHRLDRLMDTGTDGFDLDERDVARLTYAATTDVWSRAAWDRIVAESRGEEREHVGAYYWQHIAHFDALPYPLPSREYFANVRTELDAPEDLEMFKALWRMWVLECGLIDAGKTPIPPLSTLIALDFLSDMPNLAAINAGVALKTQSKATWRKGQTFRCKVCARRMGGVVNGDLLVPCPHCGARQKFYAVKPTRLKASMLDY